MKALISVLLLALSFNVLADDSADSSKGSEESAPQVEEQGSEEGSSK